MNRGFWLFLLAMNLFLATSSLCHAEIPEIYDDESWNGLRKFSKIAGQTAHKVVFHPRGSSPDLSSQRDVFIWWGAPDDVSPHEIRNHIPNGATLIVFDRSPRSLEWWSFLTTQTVVPHDVETHTPRINGNIQLPVLSCHTSLPDFPSCPDDWQIAWNHPIPMAENHAVFYSHLWTPNSQTSGSLLLFRDESQPINLMLDTLDNEKMMAFVLKSACEKRNPCIIHLFDRHAGRLPTAPTSSPFSEIHDLSEVPEHAQKFLKKTIDSLQKQRETLRVVGVIMLMVFCLLCLFVFYSFGRKRD